MLCPVALPGEHPSYWCTPEVGSVWIREGRGRLVVSITGVSPYYTVRWRDAKGRESDASGNTWRVWAFHGVRGKLSIFSALEAEEVPNVVRRKRLGEGHSCPNPRCKTGAACVGCGRQFARGEATILVPWSSS
jgi:hypothetical protein